MEDNIIDKSKSDQGPLEGNLSFYHAFESLDMRQMESVWAKGNAVGCVPPGWGLLTGWTAVMKSWSAIFENTSLMQFRITDAQLHLAGDYAWVVCVENATSVVSGQVSEFRILTTNILIRSGELWLMVHHHGSPLYES